MKTLFAAALIAAAGTTVAAPVLSTSADARQSTRSFSCDGVRKLINRNGAVVLNTKNSNVYKRFVRNYTYCSRAEYAVTTSVPTKSGSCRVRACDQTPPLGGGFRGLGLN